MSMTLSLARTESTSGDRAALPFHPSQLNTSGAPHKPATLRDHLRTIHDYSTRHRYYRNEIIFGEGDASSQVYRIISGTVRLCRHTADGRRHIADFIYEGDLMGFVDCQKHSFTAEAVSDVTLISYPRNRVDRLIGSDPQARALVLSHLSQNLLTAQDQHFILGCQNAKERVASFFLRLAERTDVRSGDRLDLTMGRQDIADHLGLTIETVCRAIAALKVDGLVVVPNSHQMILTDVAALKRFTAGSLSN